MSHLKGATVTVSQGAIWHRNNQVASIFSILIFFFLVRTARNMDFFFYEILQSLAIIGNWL